MKPQKALHLHEDQAKKKPKSDGQTYLILEKYDGWYGYFDVSDEPSWIMSRAQRMIPSLKGLSERLSDFRGLVPKGRLIFEILIKGVPEFKDLNGILNRSKGDCEAKGAYLRVHDFIPEGKSTMPANVRHAMARGVVKQLNQGGFREALIAPVLDVGDTKVVRANALKVWARNGEGVIGKRIDSPYSEGKRNADLIKVKEEVTLELKVVDLEQGEGKYLGTLGALVCEDKHGNRHSLSGMLDEERDLWWHNPSLIVGKVVEVKAMKVLPNGSLREGRFKAVRYDKSIQEID